MRLYLTIDTTRHDAMLCFDSAIDDNLPNASESELPNEFVELFLHSPYPLAYKLLIIILLRSGNNHVLKSMMTGFSGLKPMISRPMSMGIFTVIDSNSIGITTW